MNIELLFSYLDSIDNFIWEFLGFPAVVLLGIYFSWKTGFVQVRRFPQTLRTFWSFLTQKQESTEGVHPLGAFFACLGGCVGIANLVTVCTAVQIGGPGALFWLWITALFGMLIKYSEIYLGFRYRVHDKDEGYSGGPMYFLSRVFHGPMVPMLTAFLICIYGVEIYQFKVVSQTISTNFSLPQLPVTMGLLVLVFLAGAGGVKRVGAITSMIIPIFMLGYLTMGAYVILVNIAVLPGVLKDVFVSAFTGHAAVGGFVGSTLIMTISQGIRRACYSSDVGVGYASVIHSQSSVQSPEKQASLAFFDIFLDTFCVCTMSILLILVTGIWKEPLDESLLVQTALADYFPFVNFYMPAFLFLLGYSTVISFFVAGLKCANYLHPKYGKPIFYIYSCTALFLFSFLRAYHALIVMSIVGGTLLVINVYGMFKLRHEISFNLGETEE